MKPDIRKRFGDEVRRLRLRPMHQFGRAMHRAMSQNELAERSKLHRTYINAVERGHRNVSLETIEKIAEGLGVTLQRLFARVPPRNLRRVDRIKVSLRGSKP